MASGRLMKISGDLYQRPCRANCHYKSSIHSAAAVIISATCLPQASGYSSEVVERHEQNRYGFLR